MQATTERTVIESRILKSDDVEWKKLQFIQQEGFKDFSKTAKAKLKESILNNNFIQPFYVWRAPGGVIYCLDGFHRVKDLTELEEEGVKIPAKLPAVFVKCKNEQEAAKLVLLYSSIYATVNEDGFQSFIDAYNLDLLELSDEINLPDFPDMMLPIAEVHEDDYVIPDDIETDIIEGDIFQIGQHVLLCGSATDAQCWKTLMGDQLADLVITDPPYNVSYVGGTKKALTIMNDKQTGDQFYRFLHNFYSSLQRFCKPGSPWYVWHADSEGVNFRSAMVDAGILLKQCLIWVKNSIVMGRQDYHWQHEPCLYGWTPGAPHRWFSDRKQSTVLYFDRPQRSEKHPTMKPVLLISYQMANSSRKGDMVADGFGGSGTTMVAAHQLGMKCRMIELDPKYCQVIIDRMLQLEPGLQVFRNGHFYERVANKDLTL